MRERNQLKLLIDKKIMSIYINMYTMSRMLVVWLFSYISYIIISFSRLDNLDKLISNSYYR